MYITFSYCIKPLKVNFLAKSSMPDVMERTIL